MSRLSPAIALVLVLSCMGAACSHSAPEEIAKKKPAEAAAKPASEKPQISRAAAATDVQPALEIDPARVPVEEDFAEAAAERITKRTDLPTEIQRLSAAIEKAKSKE